MRFRIGIDSGGTFTDLLLVDSYGGRTVHKTSSTPDDPARAVMNGLREIAPKMGLTFEELIGAVDVIVHGTTVTTNALLTRRGARTGLICTEGFRDTLPLRDGRREEPYNNRLPVPVPLVARHLRIGVPGRLDYSGAELTPLDEDGVRRAAEMFKRSDVEAITICLNHSPSNPEHERRAAQIVTDVLPQAYLTVSSDLLAQVGLFERTSTAVLNSYVSPIISRYMASLTDKLQEAGFTGVLLLMQSNGGVAAPEVLAHRAALSLLSGPASGPAAGLAIVNTLGTSDCITIDMGGTSFDAAIVHGGQPLVMTDGWVDRWRLALPMLDIHTVGAGGGSVAYVNTGMLRVGPFSAGADPGPACYGRGGELPTVTDADLLLGYLGTGGLLGGTLELDAEAARAVIDAHVGQPLGLSTLEAAAGIYDLVNVNMAEGVREVSVNRGWDPRDFPLVVAGGAGPVHAAAIAEEIGIPVLVVPRESSVFCAGGMLLADFKHDYVISLKGLLQDIPPIEATRRWRQMRDEGFATLAAEGLSAEESIIVPALDLRYRGQWHELTITVPAESIDHPGWADILKDFHAQHDLLFGYSTPEMPVEVMNVRLGVVGRTKHPSIEPLRHELELFTAPSSGHRPAWSRSARALVEFATYDGLDLVPGAMLDGPALIDLPTTTIVVPETYRVVIDRHGSFVLQTHSHTIDVNAKVSDPLNHLAGKGEGS